ncbi:hypothetical protein ABZS52_12095 [Micromonospora profundi]|uniref:hypothetical protein n=1 Tax=Micromonospora profundi TaxID=1420889 RepID=UPI0033B7F43B
MAAWVGDAAREPGDLDYVVTPHTITSDNAQARRDDAKNVVRADPGPGLQPDRITEAAIWNMSTIDGGQVRRPLRSAPRSTVTVPNLMLDPPYWDQKPQARSE